jgi:hypothetical protein
VEYQSLQDILADEELALGNIKATVDDVRRAIDARLRALQADTVTRTPDIYRRLVNAREALDRLERDIPEHKSAELVPLSFLERVLDIIQKPVPTSGPGEPPPIERMRKSRSVAITKASEDFRKRRTLPTAGIGAIAAAVWATRQIFGVNVTHVGTINWAIGAGSVVIIAVILLLLMRKAQRNDEQVLRQLYDPDVQGSALRGGPITRSQYRTNLWYMSVVPTRRLTTLIAPIRRLRRRRAYRLQLQLEYESKMEAGFDDRQKLRENLRMHEEKLHSYYPPVVRFSEDYVLIHRFADEGVSRFLSTVDLASALEEASQLALARLVELSILEPVQRGAIEEFRTKNV